MDNKDIQRYETQQATKYFDTFQTLNFILQGLHLDASKNALNADAIRIIRRL